MPTNEHPQLPSIHAEDPYVGFDHTRYPLDLRGWGSLDPNFETLIRETKPRLIIEVGSWKGASAIHMAEMCRALALECRIICVDTWLGAIEFLYDKNDEDRYVSLQKSHGYPTVYYQFLANVVHKGLQDFIIPFPQTSTLAARFLATQGVTADLVFIDGSHDDTDVYQDLQNYWPLVSESGYMFGDDYDDHWPGVRMAVNNFAVDVGVELGFTERQWMLKKGPAPSTLPAADIHSRLRDCGRLKLEFERKAMLAAAARDELALRLSTLEDEMTSLKRQLSVEKNSIDSFRQQLESCQAARTRLQQRNQRLRERMTSLRQTWSWWMTRPLRVLGRPFRGDRS